MPQAGPNKGTDAQHLGYPSGGNPQSPQGTLHQEQSRARPAGLNPPRSERPGAPSSSSARLLRRSPPAHGPERPAARPADNWASRGLLHSQVSRLDNLGPDPPQLRKSRSGGAGPELPAAAKLLLHGAAQGWSRCEPDTSPERGLTVTVSAGPRAERKTHAQRAHFRPPEGPQALRVSAALPAAGCARPPVRSPREVSVAMPDGNHRCSISIPRGVILSLNAAFKY